MSWEHRLLAPAQAGEPLRAQVARLLALQRAAWPELARGQQALAEIRTRRLDEADGWVQVQSNPRRRVSSAAKVDAASVAKRPCFLCEANLPAEERGVAFAPDLILVPNPFPVLPDHLSVMAREHTPQALRGRVPDLLTLARALGPDMMALYNGPRCGASAPDHFHFQACSAALLPIAELLGPDAAPGGIHSIDSFGRRALAFLGEDTHGLCRDVNRALDWLGRDEGDGEEPMVNLIARFARDRFTVLLFPRARHRPACFFAAEPARMLVSPGALDMAGVVVVADPDHFDRIDAAAVRGIFEEVSLERARFARLVEALA